MAEKSTEETRPLLDRTRTGSVLDAVAKGHAPAYSLTKWQRRCACGAILLAVMFERLTYYGINSNLVMFLNEEPFGWLSYDAANASLIFLGVSFVFSVLGGLLADTLFGRFKTIIASFVVYILGVSLLVLIGYGSIHNGFLVKFCGNVSVPFANVSDLNFHPTADITEPYLYCGWAIYLSLVVTAMAAGSVRSNLSPFGGDQVRYEGPEVMRTFFNWYYWAINAGSLMAFAGVTALQQNLDFFIGFIVPLGSLIIATIVFIVGRTWYLSRRPMGSVLTNASKIIVEAFKRRNVHKSMVRRQDSNEFFSARTNPSFLDMAKVRFGGSFHESMVNDVKSLKKIILVFLGLVPYWVVYFQMQTTFLIQGLHMRFEVNCSEDASINKTICSKTNFQIPPAWLTLFDVVAVLILLPVFDRTLYPWLDRHGIKFTLLRRMIIGMLFSVVAMTVAGVLEHYRLAVFKNNHTVLQTIGKGATKTVFYGADIWIFCQIPQYTLIGISEVFAIVAGLEFAYSMAPPSMQGLIMGMFYLATGCGAFIGSAILKLTTIQGIEWLSKQDKGNINDGRLDLYFFMLGAFQFVALVVFTVVALYHERKEARQRSGSTAINKNHHDDGLTGQS